MFVALVPFVILACSAGRDRTESVGTIGQAATVTATQSRIAGFEQLSDWSTVSGNGTLSVSTDRVEGASALAISSTQSITVQSIAFGTVSGGFRKVDLQIKVPSVSKVYAGSVQVSLVSASKSLNTAIGQSSLSTYGGYANYSFVVPSSVVTSLGTSHTDLRFVINVELQTAGAILIDKMVLSGARADVPAAPWGSTSPIATASSLAYASQTGAPTVEQTPSVNRLGAFVDTVPLEVPPGRAGMQPSLSLAYNTQSPNGALGVGWGLQGISSISRCPWTLARDGFPLSVRVKKPRENVCPPGVDCTERFTEYRDNIDNFCLDGQKLVKTGGTATDPEFRTEHDTFAKVTASYAGQYWPATFKVYTKDGRIHTYDAGPKGTGYDSYDANGVPTAAYKFEGVLAWHLSRTEDRFGNAISYTYQSGAPTIGGTAQPSTAEVIKQIDYTTCAPNSACPYGGATNRVRFEYEDRVDLVGGFAGGLSTTLGKRLAKIRSEYLNPAGTFSTLQVYILSYDQSAATNRSRLTQIQECPLPPGEQEGSTCKPPLKFTWGGGEGQYFRRRYQIYGPTGAPGTLPSWLCQSPVNASNPQPGCVWVDYKVTDAWNTHAPYLPDAVGDFDGNGTDDFVARDDSQENRPFLIRTLRNGLANDLTFVREAQDRIAHEIVTPDVYHEFRTAVDIDGDGQSEMFREIGKPLSGNNNFRLERWSPDTSKFTPVKVNNADFLLSGGGLSSPSFMDLNGDGFLDAFYDDGAPIYPGNTYGTFYYRIAQPTAVGAVPAFAPQQPAGASYGEPWGDYGGYPAAESPAQLRFCKIRAIDIAGSSKKTFYRYCDIGYDRYTRYIDINGDGTDDSVVIKGGPGNYIKVRESTGIDLGLKTGNKPEGQMPAPYDAVAPGSLAGDSVLNFNHNVAVPVDFDGDGQQDVIQSVYDENAFGTTVGQTVYLSRRRTDLGPANCGAGTPCQATRFEPIMLPTNGARDAGDAMVLSGTITADLNGDGLPDIIQRTGSDSFQFVVQDPSNRDDVITGVDDGRVASTVRYFSGPTATLDTNSASNLPMCAGGTSCLRKAQNVVVSATLAKNGTGEATRYYYEEPIADLNGRGFVGYVVFVEQNVPRAQATRSVFNLTLDGSLIGKHSYPFVSKPTLREWRSGSAVPTLYPNLTGGSVQPLTDMILVDRFTSSIFINRKHLTNGGLTYFTETTNETIQDFDGAASTAFRTTTTGRTYDDFGNITAEGTGIAGGESRDSTNICTNTITTWLIGQCTDSTVKSTRNGESLTKVVKRTFTAEGALQTRTTQPDDATLEVVTTLTRDTAGLVRSRIAKDKFSNVRTSVIDYDSKGLFVEHQQDGAGHDEWFATHPGIGKVVVKYDAGGRRSDYGYDNYGRPVSIQEPGEAAIWLAYAASTTYSKGRKTTQTIGGANSLQGSNPVVLEFDSWGRRRRTAWKVDNAAAPDINDIEEYDSLGRLTKSWKAKNATLALVAPATYSYDNLDNLRVLVEADGAREEMTFTTPLDTQVVRTTSAGSSTVLMKRATDGVLAATVKTAVEGTRGLTNLHGPFGLLRKTTEDSGPTKEYQYDNLGRKIHVIDAESGQTDISYTGFGEVSRVKRLAATPAQVTDYYYDAVGRMVRSVVDTQTSSFVYDLQGANGVEQLGYSISSDGVYKYRTYDSYGRVDSETTGDGTEEFTVRQSYDNMGRLEWLGYPDVPGMSSLWLKHEYDATTGTLDRISEYSSGADWFVSSSRDQVGRGLDTKTLGIYEHREVDPVTLLTTRITDSPPYASPYYEMNYRYYSGGSPSVREDVTDLKTDEYYYNGFDELKQWIARDNGVPTTKSYQYDKLGNPTGGGVTRTYGNGNAVHQIAAEPDFAITFGFDKLGRQIDKYKQGVQIRHVDYTTFDLPKVLTVLSPIKGVGSKTYNYKYDAQQQRFKKTDGTNSTTYISDLYEKRVTATGTKHIFYGWADDRRVVQRTFDQASISSTDTVIFSDALGSVSATATAGTVQRVWYSPWGDKFKSGRTSLGGTTVGFTDQEQEDEVSLINMKGRIYDPYTATFLTPDPIISNPTISTSHNPYLYGLNNPLKYTDPSGFEPYSISCGPVTALYSQGGSATSTYGADHIYGQFYMPGPVSYSGAPGSGPGSAPGMGSAPGTGSLDSSIGFGPNSTEGGGPNPSAAAPTNAAQPTRATGDQAEWPDDGEWRKVKDGPSVGRVPNQLLESPAMKGDPDAGEFFDGLLPDAVLAGIPGGTIEEAIISKVLKDGGIFLRASRGGYRLHGKIPNNSVLKKMATRALVELREITRTSIATREAEMLRLGAKGGHALRLGQERRLLQALDSLLRNLGVP